MKAKNFDNDYPIAWCPGCGNFSILNALKQALEEMAFKPHEIILVSGIGQAAKLPHYLRCNYFNGIHGWSLPVATAIRVANADIPVIVIGGDGDTYGEGGNHFIHALRRNINVTLITHNNQVFGLTRGQASPTCEPGFETPVQTHGVFLSPFNPISLAIDYEVPFVARGFMGDVKHLTGLIKEAIDTTGFSLLDVLQSCVSYDRVHTVKWYRDRVYNLNEEGHDTVDPVTAIKKSKEWGERIPVGILYRNAGKPTFEQQVPVMKDRPLVERRRDPSRVDELMMSFL